MRLRPAFFILALLVALFAASGLCATPVVQKLFSIYDSVDPRYYPIDISASLDSNGDIAAILITTDGDLLLNAPVKDFLPGKAIRKLNMKVDNVSFDHRRGGMVVVSLGSDRLPAFSLKKVGKKWVAIRGADTFQTLRVPIERTFGLPTGIKKGASVTMALPILDLNKLAKATLPPVHADSEIQSAENLWKTQPDSDIGYAEAAARLAASAR